MTARLGTPKDARNISQKTKMSGCCSNITAITFFLLLGMQIIFVDSRDYQKQKRFTRDDVCNETVNTMKDVSECPLNEESMTKRSKGMRCEETQDFCTAEKLVYHCVRYGKKLIEVCAPRNYITGKCCVQFNVGVGRIVEDYSVPCSECPFHYYSNESISYQTCLESVKSVAAVERTKMTTIETSTVSKSTPEPRPKIPSYFPISTGCRYATGRRKRSVTCSEFRTNTTDENADYIHSNDTNVVDTEVTRNVWT
ncbi:uncharacterized protein LOC133200473 [Saccostrea echinata]|uniref:uncharacterized protein LOC133200473 n=1 Tax=Saccostrea echinata TaxID=191078 RepID=UPI002A81DD26|nr:uncharacterized protein LOC133200473 [Saccostrea echinata]